MQNFDLQLFLNIYFIVGTMSIGFVLLAILKKAITKLVFTIPRFLALTLYIYSLIKFFW